MRIEDYISISPDICHGKPCLKGTRIMAYLILDMLESEATLEEIQDAYPEVMPEHVKAVLHYAARVLEAREFDPAFLKVQNAFFTG